MKTNQENKKIKKYLEQLSAHIVTSNSNITKLIKIKKKIIKTKNTKNKVLIFGNGGSSAIASHFSIDLINKIGIRCLNFSDDALLTCFANDYGFHKWIYKAIDLFCDRNDVIIFISSSGQSKNMIEGINLAKKKKINNLITFTGGKKNNPLSKKGNINLWVNSKIYNHIENAHQIWLLSIVDSIKLNKLKFK